MAREGVACPADNPASPGQSRIQNPGRKDSKRADKSKDVKTQKQSHQVTENTGASRRFLYKTNPYKAGIGGRDWGLEQRNPITSSSRRVEPTPNGQNTKTKPLFV